MLDIKLVRQTPEKIKAMLETRNASEDITRVDELLRLDEQRRKLIAESDELKAQRNKVSNDIAQIKKNKSGSADELIAEMKIVSDKITEMDIALRDLETEQENILLRIPNILHESVPVGKTAADNVVHKEVLQFKRDFDFTPKDHLELGKSLRMDGPRRDLHFFSDSEAQVLA